jgi:hypothetical protein
VEILKTFKVVPSMPVGGSALIRMQKLLAAWHNAVKESPKTVPNVPNDEEIVR